MLRPEMPHLQCHGSQARGAGVSILVTGGAGFLGSHLCDRLIQRGHRVICLDNLLTGRLENIRPLQNHPRFRFLKHDVREPLDISEPVQQIYNLACAASPRHYQRDPVGTLQTCVTGAHNVLNLAQRNAARVLQASTSEVYGDPSCTRRLRSTSDTSILSVRARAMTRASGRLRRCFSTITACTAFRSKLPASSTPTGRVCWRMTAASSQIS